MGMQQAPAGSRVGNQNPAGVPGAPPQAPMGTPMSGGGYAGQAQTNVPGLPGYGSDPNFAQPPQAPMGTPMGGGGRGPGNYNFGNDPSGFAGGGGIGEGLPPGGITAGLPGMPAGAIPAPAGGYYYNGRHYQTGQNPYAETPALSQSPGAQPPAPPAAPETPPYTPWQYGEQPDPTAQSVEDFLFNRFSGPGAYEGGYALDPLTMRGIPMQAYQQMQRLGTWDAFRFSPQWQGYQGPMAGQTMMVDPSFDFSQWTTPPRRPQAPQRPDMPLWQQRRNPTLLDRLGGP